GYENGSVMAVPAQRSANAIAARRGGVKHGDRRNMLAIELQIAGTRVETIQREFLARDIGTQCRSLVRQPEGARLVASCRRAVRPLRIPRRQPRFRARRGIAEQSGDSGAHGIQNALPLTAAMETQMRIHNLYTTSDGQSHFRDIEVEWAEER